MSATEYVIHQSPKYQMGTDVIFAGKYAWKNDTIS